MLRLLAALLLPLFLLAAEIPTPPASALLWDLSALTRLRQQTLAGDAALAPAVARLCKDADRHQGKPLESVVDKAIKGALPEGQDPQDYRSVSIYYWADPADPKAPWIKRDGDANREEMEKYDAPRFRRVTDRIRDGVLAWWFTGKDAYADDAIAQLRHWFLDPATCMRPNLNYAQFVPGRNEGKGNAHGLIDSRYLMETLSAVSLLEAEGRLSDRDRQGLRAWFDAYLTWLTTSDLGKKEGAASNNHGLYYDAQVVAYALYLGDKERARAVLAEVGPRRLAQQIAVDGSMPLELGRPTAGTYVCFTLEAIAQLVALERHAQVGTDLWAWSSADGRSFPAAIRWTLPYVLEGKVWAFGRTEDPLKSVRVSQLVQRLTAAGVSTGMEEVLSRHPLPADDRLRLLAPRS